MVVEETNKVKTETRYLSLLLGAASAVIFLFGVTTFVMLSKAAAVAQTIGNVDYANTIAILAEGSLIVSLAIVVMLMLFLKFINKRMRKQNRWFANELKKRSVADAEKA